jgi:hypothetical protein
VVNGGPDSAALLGLDRLCYVKLIRGRTGLRAEVEGVCHHRPVTRRVPVRVAGDLVAAGVPVVTA